MNEQEPIYTVPEGFARQANLTPELYKKMYDRSIADPEGFWSEQGRRLDWMTPYSKAKNCLLYTSPSPRDGLLSRMPSSA